jgi:hypothetical protein
MNTSERVKEIMTIERIKEEILEREKARTEAVSPVREKSAQALEGIWNHISDNLERPRNIVAGALTGGTGGAVRGAMGQPSQVLPDDIQMPVHTGEEGMSVPRELQGGDTGNVAPLLEMGAQEALDPLNYFGPGLFKSGNLALDAAGVPRGYEGMLMANPSNMLEHYYNPGHKPPTVLEDLLAGPQGEVNSKGAQYNKTIAGKRRAEGAVKSLAQGGFRGVLDMFNPTARANWKQGVSRNSQRIVAKTIERAEGPKPILEGGAKKSKEKLLPNPDYPVPYWRQPKFDKLWDNKQWREGYLKDKQTMYNQAIDEGLAQVTYNSHMVDQSGFPISKEQFHESMQEARRRIFLEPATPNEHGTITSLLRDNAGEVRTTGYEYARKANGDFKINPETGKRIRRSKTEAREQSLDEAKYIENHILNAQGLPAGEGAIVVKPPAGQAGHHFNDVVYTNPGNTAQIDLMKKNWDEFNATGEVPMDKFEAHWKNAEKTQSGDNKYRILDFDEDGVWITGGKTGRSIVEGGVNFIAKYRNDGTLMAVMSDKHDFLEKMPVVGDMVKGLLPNDLVAISPAMETDIFRLKPTNFKDPKYGVSGAPNVKKTAATQIPKTVPPQVTKDNRGYVDLLKDYVNAKPESAVLDAERRKVGGMLATPATPFINSNEDLRTAGGLPMALLNNEEQAKRRGMLAATGEVSPTDSKPFYS